MIVRRDVLRGLAVLGLGSHPLRSPPRPCAGATTMDFPPIRELFPVFVFETPPTPDPDLSPSVVWSVVACVNSRRFGGLPPDTVMFSGAEMSCDDDGNRVHHAVLRVVGNGGLWNAGIVDARGYGGFPRADLARIFPRIDRWLPHATPRSLGHEVFTRPARKGDRS
jgi:hypothetical protein